MDCVYFPWCPIASVRVFSFIYDHVGMRTGIAAAVAETCDVVGAAKDGRKVLRAVDLLTPYVRVLMSLLP